MIGTWHSPRTAATSPYRADPHSRANAAEGVPCWAIASQARCCKIYVLLLRRAASVGMRRAVPVGTWELGGVSEPSHIPA